jgi:hypothetical protein
LRRFRTNSLDPRKTTFLSLTSQVEGQLRDAYAIRNDAGLENQVTLAKKIGVGRSAINKLLGGHRNLTLKTIADIVWALGYRVRVLIYDPSEVALVVHRISLKPSADSSSLGSSERFSVTASDGGASFTARPKKMLEAA